MDKAIVTVTVTNPKTGESETREISYDGPHEVDYKVGKLVEDVTRKWGGEEFILKNTDKVMIAFYVEYQKNMPQMANVNPWALGLSGEEFTVAVRKLQEKNFIKGAVFTKTSPAASDFVKVTTEGEAYVEQILDIHSKLSSKEKADSVLKKAILWGWEEIKDFGAKVVAEMSK